jgi:hypothetical protein
MPTLKPGWPAKVTAYLLKQVEPVTIKLVAHEALGLDSSKLSHDEFNALSRVVYNSGWRSQTFWIPPAGEGPWTEVEAAA